MSKSTIELLKLIKENPDLDVLPMVSGDVVGGDDYVWWLGSLGKPFVDEFIIDDWYGDGCVRLRSESDEETIIEGIAEIKFGDCTNEENWRKAEEYLKGLWEKVIVVWIGQPGVD